MIDMGAIVVGLVMQAAALGAGYSEAYHESVATGKPLLVLVGADWCPACRTMKEGTMSRMARQGKLSGVNYAQVDYDRQGAVAQRIVRGGAIPQLVIYYQTPQGWRVNHLVGAQSEAEVQRLISRALENSAPRKVEKTAETEQAGQE